MVNLVMCILPQLKKNLIPKKKKKILSLTGVVQKDGHHPTNQEATSSILSQCTYLIPGLGVCERQLINVSLAHQCCSPSFPAPLSLSKK